MLEDVTVKVLLDSGVTEMFMNRKIAAKHGFRLQKPERLVTVRNVDNTNNSRGTIMHQVKVNIYYKNHIERMRRDIIEEKVLEQKKREIVYPEYKTEKKKLW